MNDRDDGDDSIVDASGRDLSPAARDGGNNFLRNFFSHLGAGDPLAGIAPIPQPHADVRTLDVSMCRLGHDGSSRLFSFLSGSSFSGPPWPKLTRLRMRRNAIGSAGGCSLGRFLSSGNPLQLEMIDVGLNDLGAGGGIPSAAEVLAESLGLNSTLKELSMDRCALGPGGATSLAAALAKNDCLASLDLAGNMIGPLGGDAIFRALRLNRALKRLGLRMNRIGGGADKSDLRSLSNSLIGGRCCLANLDLSYNDLRCSGASILSEALAARCCTLRELLLEKNDISADGATALSVALGGNTTLRKLVLKGNDIGDAGAVSLGGMMKRNDTLKDIDLSSCSIGNKGGAELGDGLAANATIECLMLEKNALGGDDTSIFSVGLSMNSSLRKLNLSENGLGAEGDAELWGAHIAAALSGNSSLIRVDISNNTLSDPAIVAAVAEHPSLEYFDMSDNNLEVVTVETQLLLSKRLATMEVDLSLNPLSSPPLGRLADYSSLSDYVRLLADEKTAVTRIRLMVLGYGGVGKSTFCRAITNESDANNFHCTLVPVEDWGVDRVSDWACRLGTAWSCDAVQLILDECISGMDLTRLVDRSGNADAGTSQPSKLLLSLCSSKYPSVDAVTFAKAVAALLAKGYLSTVGAVKVTGTVQLGKRTCSLVDFAGQTEFLVSHQLLLSSMHTLCMIIQPAPSFERPGHGHYGSWDYWSKFLSSLGDRRRGSLLLAVSQLDKLIDDGGASKEKGTIRHRNDSSVRNEFDRIGARSAGIISGGNPLKLDYRPDKIGNTILSVKRALTKSTDLVAQSWWVPSTYETLADILRNIADRKSSNQQLPILTKTELINEMNEFCDQHPETTSSKLMEKMKVDHNLLRRAINYLEAVGDIMRASDDWLLIDPVGWFSSFLAHFIKDDLAVTAIQVDSTNLRCHRRGMANLNEIVDALRHEYDSPERHISQIMELLCGLELCVLLKTKKRSATKPEVSSGSVSHANKHWLFPCLLPSRTQSDLTGCESLMASQHLSNTSSLRGHRFREATGFIPPGLFVGLLARMYQGLQSGSMHPTRMWKDSAIIVFNKGATHVLLRVDLDKAVIDVIGWAQQNEHLFVGAAKGQASVVSWVAHFIHQYLLSYSKLIFEESWLCPNARCHGAGVSNMPAKYRGSEFSLCVNRSPRNKAISHDCNAEGCWRFLGTGHSLNQTVRCSAASSFDMRQTCVSCKNEPIFKLRDKI